MATVALSGIITPTNVVTATSTSTLTNKTLTGAVMNGTLGATTPSTVVATTVKASTTMGVGDATPSTSGAGITFPADQTILGASTNANTLDDYEEGTWSPSIGGSTTYLYQDGYYTKCGNVVTVTGRMQINSQAGNANTYQITNLPFTSKNTSNGSKAGGGSVGYWSSTAINVISLQTYVETNTTNLAFQYLASAASTALTATIFGNSTDVYFTATYLTA